MIVFAVAFLARTFGIAVEYKRSAFAFLIEFNSGRVREFTSSVSQDDIEEFFVEFISKRLIQVIKDVGDGSGIVGR